MKITQKDLVHEIHLGNKMAIRFQVAKGIAEYLNTCAGKMLDIDVEIKLQCKPLFEEYESGRSVRQIVDDWHEKGKKNHDR